MTTSKSVKKFIPKSPAILKILIIEDNPINVEAFKVLLENLGIVNISIANSGKEALPYFSDNLDIIFTDFHLPDTDAIEIAKHYRTVFPKKDTPIICCSSDIQLKYQDCINAEINGFLPKPYNMEILLELLECWLPHINFEDHRK